jgi:hypothetical protein
LAVLYVFNVASLPELIQFVVVAAAVAVNLIGFSID